MSKIVTLTVNPAIDKSTRTSVIVAEKKLRCENPQSEPGGGGINVSRAIQKLGGQSLALLLTGGYSGQFMEDLIKKEQIDYRSIPIAGDTRENFIVVDASSGSQYRFGMKGPVVTEKEADLCLKVLQETLPKTDYLVASGSLSPGMPDDFYAKVARLAQKANCRLVLDTSGKALELAANDGVFLLKPNLNELSMLFGVEELQMNEVADAAHQLIDKGFCEIMVVSLGPAGAMLVSASEKYQITAPVVKKQSTVGAGDSMVAGLVWSLSQKKDLKTALQYGIACGTAATINPGTALCKKEDVDRLFAWISTQK